MSEERLVIIGEIDTNAEMPRLYTQSELDQALATQHAEIAEKVQREKTYFNTYASQTLTRTVNSEYETGQEIFRKVLAIIEGEK